MAQVLLPSIDHIAQAAEVLREGGTVGMPTETVYGLAGRVFDERALARIFDVKQRPEFDPLIVHVGRDVQHLAKTVGSWINALAQAECVDPSPLTTAACERVELLLDAFWPGPLTLVLPKHVAVPGLATSGLATVALRMPRHEVALDLISQTGPLAAPSAQSVWADQSDFGS